MLCKYWCWQEGKFLIKSWGISCSPHYSQCPINRKKNSDALKKVDRKNRRKTPKWSMSWWNKFDDNRKNEISIKAQNTFRNRIALWEIINVPHPHTTETKERLSLRRTSFLEEKSTSVNWYSVINKEWKEIKVQWWWELMFAEKLNSIWINFDRVKLIFQEHRHYTPDFYLPDYWVYIEIKWFFYEKDKYKTHLFKQEFPNIKILFLNKEAKIKSIKSINDILNLPEISTVIDISKIDFDKFKNYYTKKEES